MAVTEININEIISELGFEPLEGKCIVVKFEPANLSAKLIDFFVGDFYVLQICKDDIILVPFSKLTMEMKIKLEKEAALVTPKASIKSVEVEESGFNYRIVITTDTDKITLTVQQKEISSIRSSGGLASEFTKLGLLKKNWHSENLDGVLSDLKLIQNS